MKMQSMILLVLASILSVSALSQEEKSRWNAFYEGTGIAKDLESARQAAYNDLIQKIEVFISSSTQRLVTEEQGHFRDKTVQQVVARSSIVLKDVQEDLTKQSDGLYRVVKHVTRESVRAAFKLRRQQIVEHLRMAESELGDRKGVNLGAALRHYYWAQLLSKIYPDTLSYTFTAGDAFINKTYSSMTAVLPRVLETVLRDIKWSPVRRIDDEAVVWIYAVRYQDRPAFHLRFSYFDGVGQTDGEVRNGETKLTFYFPKQGAADKEVLLNVDFRYEEEMDEMLRLADSLGGSSTIRATVTVELPGIKEPVAKTPVKPQVTPPAVGIPEPVVLLLAQRDGFEKAMGTLNSLVRQRRVVAGSSKDFESLEGLYAVVMGNEGVLAVLRSREKRLHNLETDTEADMKQYAGKRIVWVEVLK